jgi:hypothetical protein
VAVEYVYEVRDAGAGGSVTSTGRLLLEDAHEGMRLPLNGQLVAIVEIVGGPEPRLILRTEVQSR